MKQFQRAYIANLLTVILILLAGIVSAQALATEIYSWTDKDGIVHFGDKPPEGQQAEYINVPEAYRPGTTDAYPPAETQEVDSFDADAGVIPGEEAPVPLTAAQSRRDKMAKDREERFATAAELAQALARSVGQDPVADGVGVTRTNVLALDQTLPAPPPGQTLNPQPPSGRLPQALPVVVAFLMMAVIEIHHHPVVGTLQLMGARCIGIHHGKMPVVAVGMQHR